jgi:Leucine-rich repeat (LRR) protein
MSVVEPLEFREGYGFVNPLRNHSHGSEPSLGNEEATNTASNEEATKTVSNEEATNTASAKVRAIMFMAVASLLVGAFLFSIGIAAISFANELPADESMFQMMYRLSPMEYMLLCSVWPLGTVIVINATTTLTRTRIVVYGGFVIIAVAVMSAISALGRVPYSQNEEPPSAMNRGKCLLFLQGYPTSAPKELYESMKDVCPQVADFPAFVSTLDGLDEAGLDTWGGAITGLDSMGAVLEHSLINKGFPIVPLICKGFFRRCLPQSCDPAKPCQLFDDNFYELFSEGARAKIASEDFSDTRMASMIQNTLTQVVDQETHDSLKVIADYWMDMLPVIRHELLRPIKDCGRFNSTRVSLKSDKWIRASSPSFPELPCNIYSTATKSDGELHASTHFVEWIQDRQRCIFLSMLLPQVLCAGLASVEAIVFDRHLKCIMLDGLVLSLQSIIIFTTLFSSAFMVYGGSLLALVPESDPYHTTTQWWIGAYFLISLLAMLGAGSYLKIVSTRPGEHRDRSEHWLLDCLSPECQMMVLSHPTVVFAIKCTDAKQPEYLYRILFMEVIEIFLQIGATLSPQLQNGEVIVASVILVACNSVATASLLYRFAPSPARMRYLLLIEVLFDIVFTLFGILRLRSNSHLSFLEHLALIKPVLSLNMDIHDLFALLTVVDYSSRRASISIGTFHIRKRLRPTKTSQSSGLLTWLCLWTLPVALSAISVVTIWRFQLARAFCVEAIGDVAACASERYYFNVDYGILGATSCEFELVKRLECANKDITMLPEAIGNIITNVEKIDVSSNPGLKTLPNSLGSLTTLQTLDISNTNVQNYPYKLANSSHMKTLNILNSPVSKTLNWFSLGITSMPTEAPAFYREFGKTLEQFDASNNGLTEPYEICFFPQLRTLNLSQNGLRSIHLAQCNYLKDFLYAEKIDLSHNKMGEIKITEEILRVAKGRKSWTSLAGNPLVGLSIDQVTDIKQLRTYFDSFIWPMGMKNLLFRGCRFSNGFSNFLPWPMEFADMQRVRLYGNVVNDTLAALAHFRKLEILWASGNQVTGSLDFLITMSRLKELHIDYNPVQGTLSSFLHLPDIEVLDIERTGIDGTLEGLRNLFHLRELHCANLGLSGDLQSLQNLTSLKVFSANNNNFSGNIDLLTRLERLELAFLQNNQLSGTIEAICRLNRSHSALKKIELQGNKDIDHRGNCSGNGIQLYI